MNFIVEAAALRDLARVLDREEGKRGWRESNLLEEAFGQVSACGAKRQGLDISARTWWPVNTLYLQRPYFIVYRRVEPGIAVLAVLHGARDIPRVLRKRM